MPQIPNSLFSAEDFEDDTATITPDFDEVSHSSLTAQSAQRNSELANVMDVPSSLFELDEQQAEQDYKQLKNKALSMVAPATASYMQENPSFVKDDVDEVSLAERLLRGAGALSGGAVEVFSAIPEGMGRVYNLSQQSALTALLEPIRIFNPALAEDAKEALTTPSPYIPWWVNMGDVAQSLGEGAEETAEALTPDNPNFVEKVLGGTGQLASQIAVTLATGGVAGSAALFAQGVDITAEKLEETRTGEKAAPWEGLASVLGGGVTGVTEKYGLDLLLRRIPSTVRNRLTRILSGAGVEATQEVLEEVGQNLVIMGFDPRRVPDSDLAEQGLVAGTVGGIASALIPGRKKAVQVEAEMTAANEKIAASAIATTAPDEATKLKAGILDGAGIKDIFIDPGALLNYANKKDEGGVLLSNLREPLNIALESGEPVRLTREQYAKHIFGTDHYNGLSDELYYHPTATPAKTAVQELKEQGPVIAKMLSDKEIEKVDEYRKESRTKKKSLADIEPTLRQRTLKWVEKFNKGEDVDLKEILMKAPSDVVATVESIIQDIKKGDLISEEDITKRVMKTHAQTVRDTQDNIDILNQAILDRKNTGKSTKRLESRVKKLEEKNKNAAAELKEFEKAVKKYESYSPKVKSYHTPNFTEKEDPVSLKAGVLHSLNVKASKETTTAVRKTFARVRREMKESFTSAQTILGTFIEKSDLSLEKKGKYLAALRQANSVEKLQKQLPELQVRILQDVERQRKAQYKGALKKVLTKAANKGKTGGLTPALNDFAKQAKEVMGLTKAEAQARLNEADPDPLINQLLALKADPDRVSADDMEALILDLQAVYEQGAAISKANKLFRISSIQETRDAVKAAIGERPPKDRAGAPTKPKLVKESFRDAVNTAWLGWNGAWHNKLQHIFESKDANKLINDLSLFNESRKFDRNFRKSTNDFVKRMGKRVDMSERQMLQQWQKDNTERVDDLNLTKAEIRHRLMVLENPKLRTHLYENEGMTLAQEEALKATITPFDKAMMETQIDFYNDFYDRINEVYRELYGINLPKVETYVPIRRDFGDNVVEDSFLRSLQYKGGVGRSAFKERQDSTLRLQHMSDVATLQAHMHEMEYFIAYAEKVQNLKDVFEGEGNAVMNLIADKYGKPVSQTMARDLDYFATRGRWTSLAGEKFFVQLMRNFTFAQLGAKPQIGLKQLASFSAFAQDVPTSSFTEALTHLATHPKEAWKLMNESEFFNERGLNIDNDFRELRADALNGKLLNFMGRNPTFTRIVMLPIRYGDKGAIFVGGYAHVRAKRNQLEKNNKELQEIEIKLAKIRSNPELSPVVYRSKGETLTFTSSPTEIDAVGERIDTSNFLAYSFRNKKYDSEKVKSLREEAKRKGKDGVLLSGLEEGTRYEDVNPNNLLSNQEAPLKEKRKPIKEDIKKQALESFGRLANKTQQSQDPDMQSELQRTSALYRVLTQFMSSANAITRAEIEAIVEYKKGRIDEKEMAKRIAIYHFIIPNTIMFIANGFSWDSEDQLTASIVGSFTGLLILGDVIEFASRRILGDATSFQIDSKHPLELFQSLIEFADSMLDGKSDLSLEEVIEGSKTVERLLEFGGALTGIPLETLYNTLRGSVIATEGDVREGGGLMLGYSPYSLRKGE